MVPMRWMDSPTDFSYAYGHERNETRPPSSSRTVDPNRARSHHQTRRHKSGLTPNPNCHHIVHQSPLPFTDKKGTTCGGGGGRMRWRVLVVISRWVVVMRHRPVDWWIQVWRSRRLAYSSPKVIEVS